MEYVIAIVVALVVGVVAYGAGRSSGRGGGVEQGRTAGLEEGRKAGIEEGRREVESEMRSLVEAVRRGRTPEGLKSGSAAEDLQRALEQGWAPRAVEREAALREAVGRVSSFLHGQVRDPLSGVDGGEGAEELRSRIGRALGALEDLDFFLAESAEAHQGSNLVQLAQRVSREFAADHDIAVRLMLASQTISAMVAPGALMDALYLVLHNAARFGDGSTIDMTVSQEGGRARIVVRDRGKGFSEEAFARAFDPFYSTSAEGLGLGLPHARNVVEGMGGHIELRNVPDGGAEVEISFPAS